jgi:hypothetical protein
MIHQNLKNAMTCDKRKITPSHIDIQEESCLSFTVLFSVTRTRNSYQGRNLLNLFL